MNLLFAATILLSVPAAAGFGSHIARPITFQHEKQSSSMLSVAPDTFFHAVELAEGRHKATVSELDELASELEEFAGCTFEENSGPDLCEKEIQDRIDVAQILRLRIELKLRTDYLKTENLFAKDVIKEHNMEERRKVKEKLQANRDKVDSGSDLGLW